MISVMYCTSGGCWDATTSMPAASYKNICMSVEHIIVMTLCGVIEVRMYVHMEIEYRQHLQIIYNQVIIQ